MMRVDCLAISPGLRCPKTTMLPVHFVVAGLFLFLQNISCQTLDKKLQNTILKLHNGYRRLQLASDMAELVWDKALAAEAGKWSKQCTYEFKYGERGENMYYFESQLKNDVLVERAIDAWYSERYSWRMSGNCAEACSYTQIVWAKTKRIGCAVERCMELMMPEEFIPDAWFLYCLYDPKGNTYGKLPYTKGDACTNCTKNETCHDKLCADIKPMKVKQTPRRKSVIYSVTSTVDPMVYTGMRDTIQYAAPGLELQQQTILEQQRRLLQETLKQQKALQEQLRNQQAIIEQTIRRTSAKSRTKNDPKPWSVEQVKKNTPAKKNLWAREITTTALPFTRRFEYDKLQTTRVRTRTTPAPYRSPLARAGVADDKTEKLRGQFIKIDPDVRDNTFFSFRRPLSSRGNRLTTRRPTTTAAPLFLLQAIQKTMRPIKPMKQTITFSLDNASKVKFAYKPASSLVTVSQREKAIKARRVKPIPKENARPSIPFSDFKAQDRKSVAQAAGTTSLMSAAEATARLTSKTQQQTNQIKVDRPATTPAPKIPLPPTFPPDCIDKDVFCKHWKVYCSQNSYVFENCRRTCQSCDIPPPPVIPPTTPKPKRKILPICIDTDDACPRMWHLCNVTEIVTERCQQTCGLCGKDQQKRISSVNQYTEAQQTQIQQVNQQPIYTPTELPLNIRMEQQPTYQQQNSYQQQSIYQQPQQNSYQQQQAVQQTIQINNEPQQSLQPNYQTNQQQINYIQSQNSFNQQQMYQQPAIVSSQQQPVYQQGIPIQQQQMNYEPSPVVYQQPMLQPTQPVYQQQQPIYQQGQQNVNYQVSQQGQPVQWQQGLTRETANNFGNNLKVSSQQIYSETIKSDTPGSYPNSLMFNGQPNYPTTQSPTTAKPLQFRGHTPPTPNWMKKKRRPVDHGTHEISPHIKIQVGGPEGAEPLTTTPMTTTTTKRTTTTTKKAPTIINKAAQHHYNHTIHGVNYYHSAATQNMIEAGGVFKSHKQYPHHPQQTAHNTAVAFSSEMSNPNYINFQEQYNKQRRVTPEPYVYQQQPTIQQFPASNSNYMSSNQIQIQTLDLNAPMSGVRATYPPNVMLSKKQTAYRQPQATVQKVPYRQPQPTTKKVPFRQQQPVQYNSIPTRGDIAKPKKQKKQTPRYQRVQSTHDVAWFYSVSTKPPNTFPTQPYPTQPMLNLDLKLYEQPTSSTSLTQVNTTLSKTTPVKTVCTDVDIRCPQWSQWCGIDQYVDNNCQKLCKNCR